MKPINYNNLMFKTIQNSDNGETTEDTIFHYRQEGSIISANYAGGSIVKGHLIGLVDSEGSIEMRYHQVNIHGQLMSGVCYSKPEIMVDGLLRLHETWEWTSGDKSQGTSIVQQIN